MTGGALTPFDAELQRDDPRQRKIALEVEPGMHRPKIVGRAEHKTLPADMD